MDSIGGARWVVRDCAQHSPLHSSFPCQRNGQKNMLTHDHTSLAFKSDRPIVTHKIAGKKGPPTYVLHDDRGLGLVVVLAELLIRQTRLE